MKDDIKRQLDASSADYAKKMQDAKSTEKQKKEIQDESYKQFLEKTRPMIIEALTEMGEYLKKQGHDFKILQSGKTVGGMGEPVGDSITLDIYPKYDKDVVTEHRDKHPSITYSYSIQYKKVYTRVQEYMPGSGSGSSGPDTEIPLANITKDIVQERVTRLIKENFERWKHFSF